ncbi:MAG TPA: membrane dipeptidase [Steroidobacteraceae bacterium]|jgi:membrane dipeptidase
MLRNNEAWFDTARDGLSRRQALQLVLAAAAAGTCKLSFAQSAHFERYEQALVIDGLGAPAAYRPDGTIEMDGTTHLLAAVKESGLTAVNVTVSEVGNGPNRFEEAVTGIAIFEQLIAQHPDTFMRINTADDLQVAKSSGRLGLIYGFQDTTPLESDVSRIGLFRALGVRIIQLTYNKRNLVGDGSLEPANAGLSDFGRAVIAELNRERVLIDLSHGGQRTVAEAIAASKAPVAITHTGCRALVDRPRNVYDEELRAVADKGGVVGIYLMPFLRESGQPRAEDVLRHIEHALEVCGEDHVGIGTDGFIGGVPITPQFKESHREFVEDRIRRGIAAPGEAVDVYNFVPDYNTPRRFATIADDLARRGHKSSRIEKILGGNFARLFREVW